MLSLAHQAPWHNSLHHPAAWLFTFVLVLLFPILDYLLYFRLKSTLQIYLWNILALWTLVLACLWVLRRNGLSLADIGLSFGNRPWTLGISAVIVVLLALSARSREKQSSKTSDAKLAALVNRIRRLLPATSAERSLWVLVSLTAGLCEEFLYRAWLLLFFSSALGFVWAGLLVSSIFFGFAHSYQGRSGILGTSVLGLVFGLLFVFTRSLIPGQLLHTLLDLTNGLALAKFAARAQLQPSQLWKAPSFRSRPLWVGGTDCSLCPHCR
jgi:CAAX protease family protein